MPVFHSCWNPNDVAFSNLLDRTAPLRNPTDSCCHDQDLTEWVCMPRRPGSGLECDASADHA